MTSYPFHPIADKFPLLEGCEFDDLVDDIAAYGQLKPIVVWEGQSSTAATAISPVASSVRSPAWRQSRHRGRCAQLRHLRQRPPPPPPRQVQGHRGAADREPDAVGPAIAKETGTNPMKVGRVRSRLGVASPERVGLDGKTWRKRAPAKPKVERTAVEQAAPTEPVDAPEPEPQPQPTPSVIEGIQCSFCGGRNHPVYSDPHAFNKYICHVCVTKFGNRQVRNQASRLKQIEGGHGRVQAGGPATQQEVERLKANNSALEAEVKEVKRLQARNTELGLKLDVLKRRKAPLSAETFKLSP